MGGTGSITEAARTQRSCIGLEATDHCPSTGKKKTSPRETAVFRPSKGHASGKKEERTRASCLSPGGGGGVSQGGGGGGGPWFLVGGGECTGLVCNGMVCTKGSNILYIKLEKKILSEKKGGEPLFVQIQAARGKK